MMNLFVAQPILTIFIIIPQFWYLLIIFSVASLFFFHPPQPPPHPPALALPPPRPPHWNEPQPEEPPLKPPPLLLGQGSDPADAWADTEAELAKPPLDREHVTCHKIRMSQSNDIMSEIKDCCRNCRVLFLHKQLFIINMMD